MESFGMSLFAIASLLGPAVVALLLPVPRSIAAELPASGVAGEREPGAPVGWKALAYDRTEGGPRFRWSDEPGGGGVASIESLRPNDASWARQVPVEPETWYFVSGWVRADEVADGGAGARLSLLGTHGESEHLRGTTDWRLLYFWVQTGETQTTLEVACRLGGFSAMTTGTAHCTGISVDAAGAPEPGAPFVFPNPALGGMSRTVQRAGIAALSAIGLLLVAWRLLLPPAARIPP
jgi:dolichyl-phosphate-mannose-protein mannosyltransferase